MANSRPKQENLVRQKPNWKHLPTKVVRIPEVFESQVIELARKLDNHTVSKEGLKKLLFYDVEIARCIPDKYGDNDPKYQYCGGWHDYTGMGIACIGVYTPKCGYQIFIQSDLEKFQALIDDADEIIGFNSISFDDRLLAAHGIRIKTSYDLLCEVRVASGQPPHYTLGQTRGGYSLERLAQANLGRGKSGNGELAPQLWQDGKYTAVFDYCLDDVKLMVELWNRRHWIKDPTRDKIYRLRGGSRIKNIANKLTKSSRLKA